eukprot:PhM_4_TR3370/c1_g1_i1/m.20672
MLSLKRRSSSPKLLLLFLAVIVIPIIGFTKTMYPATIPTTTTSLPLPPPISQQGEYKENDEGVRVHTTARPEEMDIIATTTTTSLLPLACTSLLPAFQKEHERVMDRHKKYGVVSVSSTSSSSNHHRDAWSGAGPVCGAHKIYEETNQAVVFRLVASSNSYVFYIEACASTFFVCPDVFFSARAQSPETIVAGQVERDQTTTTTTEHPSLHHDS